MDKKLTDQLIAASGVEYLKVTQIIELNHSRSADELTHRSHVDFLTKEQLPFEQFGMNRAYYYLSVISHLLYEAFKYDVLYAIIPVACYPTTFRRILIDFAVKVVSSGGRFIFLWLKLEKI